jgi:hypothetical protein
MRFPVRGSAIEGPIRLGFSSGVLAPNAFDFDFGNRVAGWTGDFGRPPVAFNFDELLNAIDAVAIGLRERVGTGVSDRVAVGVDDRVPVGDGECDLLAVGLGVFDRVGLGVLLRVGLGVLLRVGVGDCDREGEGWQAYGLRL